MRISCLDLDGFLANLAGATVYQDTLYVNKTGKKLSEVSTEIYFQAGTILVYGAEEQALLECGVKAGVDRGVKDGGPEGSNAWQLLYDRLRDYAAKADLRIKPGLLDF